MASDLPVYCKYCGAKLRSDADGKFCPSRNCQWSHGITIPQCNAAVPKPKRRRVFRRRKKVSERLIERLIKDKLIPEGFRGHLKFRRLHPGHWQRSAGAWSWVIEGEYDSIAHGFEIGSPDRATECLKAGKLAAGLHGEIRIDDLPVDN